MNELKDIGYLWLWAMMGCAVLYWIYEHIKEEAFSRGYWKGRGDGWKVAMRQRDLTDVNDK